MRNQCTCGRWSGALAVALLVGTGMASFAASATTQEQHAASMSVNNAADWISPNNVLGGPDVNCTQSTNAVQTWIELGFSAFTIPAADVVTGIEVSVKHSRVLTTPVRLTIDGVLTGDTRNLAADASATPCSGTSYSPAGGAADLWGIGAATLKAKLATGGVGFRLTTTTSNGESYPELFIDAVKLIVHHGPANSPPIAACQNVTVSAGASCSAAVTAAQVNNGSSDPDGDPLSLSLVPTGPYGLGANPVTLHVSDGVHDATCNATITVTDDTAPVISLVGGNPTLECALDTFVDPGASATDNCDGSVPVSVGGLPVDTGTPGSYLVSYDAVDSAGNHAVQVIRTVTVQDTIPPVITLNGDNPLILECAVDLYVDPGATLTDACGANGPVTTGGDTVDGTSPGSYSVTYDATDDAGNAAAQVSRLVTVQDTLPPVISCGTPEPATIIPPDAPISFTATAVDLCEGGVPANIDSFDCYWVNPAGKRVDKTHSCVVSFSDATITIEDSGGVKDTIEWSVTAADSTPNQAAEICSVVVKNPSGKKP